MRVIFCGDRNWTNRNLIVDRLSKLEPFSVVIHGGAPGADRIAGREASYLGFVVVEFPANWKVFGLRAGPLRNTQMIIEGKPDLVVAFHNDIGSSKGTKNMIRQAENHNLPYEIISETPE